MTALVFALDREVMYLRRGLGALSRVPEAPCPAWRSGRGLLLVTGMGPAAAERAVAWLLKQGPARVLSGGFCGGLVAKLEVGRVLWPAWVAGDEGRWALTGADAAGLVSASAIVGGAAERADLAVRSNAAVVDMETATVARLCEAAGVPVTGLRVVSDTGGRPPHPALVRALTGERARAMPLAAALLRRPWLIGDLLRLARDTRRAARRLAEAARGWLDAPTERP